MKQRTDTFYNVDGAKKHYAKWEKPGAKDYLLYDFIQMKCQEKALL